MLALGCFSGSLTTHGNEIGLEGFFLTGLDQIDVVYNVHDLINHLAGILEVDNESVGVRRFSSFFSFADNGFVYIPLLYAHNSTAVQKIGVKNKTKVVPNCLPF